MGIEKIGLPAKPAAKGSSWVLDASSCQTCQTPFSLFNRKHHCRRCGGLFCGNCSNSKVILRGQGDSPVRVCEPCKKLEEAARFQARHRGKPQKGVLKGSSVAEDGTLVKEVLGDGTDSFLSGGQRELMGGEGDGRDGLAEVTPSKDKVVDSTEATSPEKLRDQAFEQKKIYSTLKREGKNAEALLAFKRHKELSREADALELSLKKLALSQRKALAEGITSTGGPVPKPDKESPENDEKDAARSKEQDKAFSRHCVAERKLSNDDADDDLLNALKDLGWKEADLSERKVKKGPTSDVDLLAEISDSLPREEAASKKKPAKQNPTQLEILAHKRRALALKREGKPAEAKEELRIAKMLERKLEEMMLLEDENEDEDDDDELAALMRSLNKEAKMGAAGKDSSFPPTGIDIPLSFNFTEDDVNTNVDVTDDDINDPSMIAALQSMGWEEEAATMERSTDPQRAGPESFLIAESVSKQSSLQSEILTHKRRALALKRGGKVAEAKIELQEAKVLEQKLEFLKSQPISSQPIRSTAAAASKMSGGGPKGTGEVRLEDVLEDVDDGVEVDEDDLRDPEMMAALKAMGFEEDEEEILPPLQTVVKPSPREKKTLQDEILSIKRSALALKKQGRTLEANDKIRQAKVLEQKLEKMQEDLVINGLSLVATMGKNSQKKKAQIPIRPLPAAGFVSEDEEEEVEVSADDFMDPELVAALKSVGWQEEDTFVKHEKKPEEEGDTGALSGSPPVPVQPYKAMKLPPKEHARKLHLQKELLAHKRRALALKREGKGEEAKLELAQGKRLEKEMEEIDNAAWGAGEVPHEKSVSKSKQSIPALPTALGDESDEDEDVTDEDMHDPELLNALQEFGWKPEPQNTSIARDRNPLLAPSKVENPGPVEKVCNTGHKLDVAHPPYTKTAAEQPIDPIWHAIMKSASINHNQVPDMATEREDPLVGDLSFEGEDVGIGNSADLIPPLFDRPSSVPDPPGAVAAQVPSFDLLSGGVWDAPPAEDVLEKDGTEEEDDVFDSGLLAALQSIGLGPSLSGQLRGDAVNIKRLGDNQQMQGIGSLVSKRGQHKDFGTDRSTSAESGAVRSFPVLPNPAMAVSSDHDAPIVVKEAAGPSSNSRAPAADTAGETRPSLQEIKMHKRNALALKREGKTSEAREELRQAKILEKQLEMGTQLSTEEHPSPDNVTKIGGTLLSISPEKPSQTVSPDKSQATSSNTQTHKEQVRQELRQGKDRKKLQQESLAHKRKALGLRREGKIDEADAEFELAKTLEKQMEDLDRQSGKGVAQDDMGMVEDLLDPQLMAALKGLGFNDGDLHGEANVNTVSMGPPSLGKSNQLLNPPGKFSTNRPPNPTPTNVHERNAVEFSKKYQSREGRSTSPGYNVKEDRSANRNSQPIQSSGGRNTAGGTVVANKPEERAGVQWGSQQADPGAERGRSGMGGAGSSSVSASQAERQNLEDKIKREKVKAVELKRAGRQGEALEILRGAKRLEKELLAMAS